MLITKKLNDAINVQIGREMEASNQYLQIAAYFEERYLKKLAELFYKQAAEEQEHALKFLHYVTETNGTLKIPALAAPKSDFASGEEAVGLSLKWETGGDRIYIRTGGNCQRNQRLHCPRVPCLVRH